MSENSTPKSIISSTPVTPRYFFPPTPSKIKDHTPIAKEPGSDEAWLKEKRCLEDKIRKLEETISFSNNVNTISNKDSSLSLMIQFNWEAEKRDLEIRVSKLEAELYKKHSSDTKVDFRLLEMRLSELEAHRHKDEEALKKAILKHIVEHENKEDKEISSFEAMIKQNVEELSHWTLKNINELNSRSDKVNERLAAMEESKQNRSLTSVVNETEYLSSAAAINETPAQEFKIKKLSDDIKDLRNTMKHINTDMVKIAATATETTNQETKLAKELEDKIEGSYKIIEKLTKEVEVVRKEMALEVTRLDDMFTKQESHIKQNEKDISANQHRNETIFGQYQATQVNCDKIRDSIAIIEARFSAIEKEHILMHNLTVDLEKEVHAQILGNLLPNLSSSIRALDLNKACSADLQGKTDFDYVNQLMRKTRDEIYTIDNKCELLQNTQTKQEQIVDNISSKLMNSVESKMQQLTQWVTGRLKAISNNPAGTDDHGETNLRYIPPTILHGDSNNNPPAGSGTDIGVKCLVCKQNVPRVDSDTRLRHYSLKNTLGNISGGLNNPKRSNSPIDNRILDDELPSHQEEKIKRQMIEAAASTTYSARNSTEGAKLQQNKLARLLAVTNDQVQHGAPVGKTSQSTITAPNATTAVVQMNNIFQTSASTNVGASGGKTVTGSTINSTENLLKSPLDPSFTHVVDSTPLLSQLQQQAATMHGTGYRIHRDFINMRPLSANAKSASGAASAAVKQQKNSATVNQKTVQRMKTSKSFDITKTSSLTENAITPAATISTEQPHCQAVVNEDQSGAQKIEGGTEERELER